MDTWDLLFLSDTYQVHDLCQKSNMLASFYNFIFLKSFYYFVQKFRKVKIFAYHRSRYWSKSKVFLLGKSLPSQVSILHTRALWISKLWGREVRGKGHYTFLDSQYRALNQRYASNVFFSVVVEEENSFSQVSYSTNFLSKISDSITCLFWQVFPQKNVLLTR